MKKVFIDGHAGTTGLRLAQRLSERDDIELFVLDEELRKDEKSRLECVAGADVVILCLPDQAAVDIVDRAGDVDCPIIDCSTAFRTSEGWVFGIPELVGGIAEAKRISNPGCHSTGFIMAVRPLVDAGLVDFGAKISFHSVTGYSGGGKPMIEEYEGNDKRAPRQYALAQAHKHIPEMQKYSGLEYMPVFSPIVCDYYSGMLVSVPLDVSKEAAHEALIRRYEGCPLVKVRPIDYEFSEAAGEGFLAADAFSGRDDIEIFVTGKDDRIEIVSRYDNLGKGASGAAIQNMNILLGLPEETGLVIGV